MARVLVVEDDPSILDVFTAGLQLDGYEVLSASDLVSGVELLQHQPVDLVLTDLFTTVFSPNAFDELAVITQAAPATPVVVATAHPGAASCDPSV
jgi:DNA-binding NtrC family response regulator